MFGGFVGWRACVLWVSCSLGVDCVSVDVRLRVLWWFGGFGCWVFLGLGWVCVVWDIVLGGFWVVI